MVAKLRAVVEVGRPTYDDAVVGNEDLLISAPARPHFELAYFGMDI